MEHETHLRKALQRLQEADLYIKLKKCEFPTKRTRFLRFIITPKGLSMEEDRVAPIKDWSPLQSFRDIQVILGFTNFYRRIIYKFSKVSKPLSNLLVGSNQGKFTSKFTLTLDPKEAFENLKKASTTAPILRHYDLELPIRMVTDFSAFAVTTIFFQLYIVE